MFLGDPTSFRKRKDAEARQEYLNAVSELPSLFNRKLIPGYGPAVAEAAIRVHRHWTERTPEKIHSKSISTGNSAS
jgi:hypothetical protein